MYEHVEDSHLEMERVRVFELHYHVADGKLKVHEPAVDNSGLWQVSVCYALLAVYAADSSWYPNINLVIMRNGPVI